MESGSAPRVGRPRDPDIDVAVLAAARRHLAVHGYDGLSVAAVAAEAGTTRQALYRRWPSKADLATAAIAGIASSQVAEVSDDPFADLVAELRAFMVGVTRPHGVSMVGAMLQDGADPELRDLYRERVVAARRNRLRAILSRAQLDGLFDADADIETAVAACTGVLYAQHLAGVRITRAWSLRTASFVWRALGGVVDP